MRYLNVVNFNMIAYFLSFLGPIWCALLILESGMSTPASFTNLLTFSSPFSYVSSFSHGMLVIHIQYFLRDSRMACYIPDKYLPQKKTFRIFEKKLIKLNCKKS